MTKDIEVQFKELEEEYKKLKIQYEALKIVKSITYEEVCEVLDKYFEWCTENEEFPAYATSLIAYKKKIRSKYVKG